VQCADTAKALELEHRAALLPDHATAVFVLAVAQ